MIVRMWSGSVPLKRADDFLRHLELTGLADYRQYSDCLAAEIWLRRSGDRAHFTLVSRWRSCDAITAYAGPKWERAVLYPGDEAFGLQPDLTVQHYELCSGGFVR